METTDGATWIWYPGDFEVWLGNRFNNRRTERGAMFPPFWKQDSHWATVEFSTQVVLEAPEVIHITAEGSYHLMIDGKLQFGMPAAVELPVGEHRLNIKVHNPASPPALFVDGPTIRSGGHWLATYEDKIWIDENGVAHGSGIYVRPGHAHFNDRTAGPSTFRLPRRRVTAAYMCRHDDGLLIDFGRETMGYPVISGLQGTGHIDLYYGESKEEATDKEHCETLDKIAVADDDITDLATCRRDARSGNYTLPESKALRYIYAERRGEVTFSDISLEEEYAPYNARHSGSFACSDEVLNRIWQVAAYTMDLTTREFFVDGIKRDRWTWSGDAIQSYLMNYYLRFDSECVKRTIRQLRGKDPVTAHINTIMDYTFYWFKSVADYYLYTADTDFVREVYPGMRTLMDYCLRRTNADGMAEGQPDDWIFIDWVDFPMHKRGILCFEQLLFCKALEVMAECAQLLHDHPSPHPPQGSRSTAQYAADSATYRQLAEALHKKAHATFWSKERQAYLHAVEDGRLNTMVTRFPNMFAILYGYADAAQQKAIRDGVLLNDDIGRITTPYMRFYELEALCLTDQHQLVLDEVKSYWGGMLSEGATTFWEKYDPTEKGKEHLAMYGRPYGKSLCHAWGASPIYLIGKHFLGIRPTVPGYSHYEIAPVMGTLEWMEGTVPTPYGLIRLRIDSKSLRVESDGGEGSLFLPQGFEVTACSHPVEHLADGRRRILLHGSDKVQAEGRFSTKFTHK